MKRLKIILQSNLFYIILLLILSIFILINTKLKHYSSSITHDTKKITAIIESFKIDGDKILFYLKERETIVGTYYISSEEEKIYLKENLKIGMKVSLDGEITEIQNNTIPDTFNYKKYLYNKRIYCSFLIEKIILLDKEIKGLAKIKNIVIKRIQKLQNNPYLEAFILGDKNLMLNEMKETIQNNGVSHLFALSGMHLSFIYKFLDKLLKKIKFKKLFIYSFLLLYLGLASFPISFIRAILFTFFVDLNNNINLGISKIKILFIVAAITLFYNHFYLYDIGFIYTFVITFSLLFCHDLLHIKNKGGQIAMVSLITFLFSAPITIFTSYEINLTSVINNIILVPFISVVVFPLAILTFFLSFLMPVFLFFIKILECINILLNFISINLIIGKISILEIFIYYILLVIFLKTRFKFFLLIFFIYLLIIYHKEAFITYSSVYFLDVGQGDSTLFIAPQNKEVILVDTGGKITYEKEDWQIRDNEYNLAKTIIQFFKSKRIRYINLMILTHGDLDHVGYADYIINNFKIKNVMINNDKINLYEQNIIKKIPRVKNYKTKYFAYKNLNTFKYDNENDNSLISYFKINNYKFLLMGDASKNVEKDILNKYNLKADFLKVGHHGSKTSSEEEFIKKVNPSYAIISAGKKNRYNHPSLETIELLEKYQIDILNTQKLGTIEVRIGNKKYNIFSEVS